MMKNYHDDFEIESPRRWKQIQSLRAFRRAGVIYAMVQRCNDVTVQWFAWREQLFQKDERNCEWAIGTGHWA